MERPENTKLNKKQKNGTVNHTQQSSKGPWKAQRGTGVLLKTLEPSRKESGNKEPRKVGFRHGPCVPIPCWIWDST